MQNGTVAGALRLPDSEELMRSISAARRLVGHASDTTWYRVGSPTLVTTAVPQTGGRRSRTPLADGVVVQEDEVVLAADARPEREPDACFRAAAAAAQSGLHLAPRSSGWPVQPHARAVAGRRARLIRVPARCRTGHAAGGKGLDQAGIWLALIPSWDVVRSALLPVHRFTVDRHLVGQPSGGQVPARRGSPRPARGGCPAARHRQESSRYRPHRRRGQTDRRLAPIWGSMKRTVPRSRRWCGSICCSRNNDPSRPGRPATVQRVVDAVGDRSTLELLYALTKADAQATGPAAWATGATLIAELVERVRVALAGGRSPARPAEPRTTGLTRRPGDPMYWSTQVPRTCWR